MINHLGIITNYNADFAKQIVEDLYDELVLVDDQKLLEITFAKTLQQEKLDEFLKDWDIEKFSDKSLLLSYIMKTNPDLKFSNYEKPRLEGLLKYHRFHNLKLISHYAKIVRALNEENIFPMIFKGAAMKHIRPELPRAMGDIDILIPDESEFETAREICKNLGYIEEIAGEHSIDLHLPNSKEGTIDIHKYIPFEVKYDKSFLQDLLSRSKKEKVFGAWVFVPSFEDLVFLGISNVARNLNEKTSLNSIIYSLFDFQYLSEKKEDFSWNLVLKNIHQTGTYAQALLAMKFINKIIPQMLPESLLNNESINKKFINHCNSMIFYHYYFKDLRKFCKTLTIKRAIRSLKNMREYIAIKPKYFLLKRVVRKSHFLTRIFLIINSKKLRKV